MPRPAAVAQVGGFRPPEDPLTSWMGTVKVAAPGEGWPATANGPLHGVLQLLIRDLPVVPPALEGIELLALFVDDDRWQLRAYDTLAGLEPLEQPTWRRGHRDPKDYDPALKPFPLAFSEVEDSHDDPQPGLKVGGWPLELQDKVTWDEPGVEFVLQVDSDDKVGFVVVDSGLFYVGRRRATGGWHATRQFL